MSADDLGNDTPTEPAMIGRPRTRRGTVDDYISLDVSHVGWLMLRSRTGRVIWQSPSGEDLYAASLQFQQDAGIGTTVSFMIETGHQHSYRIDLTSTEQYFGGRRLWFLCPTQSDDSACGRRVRLLYVD